MQAVEKAQQLAAEQRRANQADKRAVWDALQTHVPELAQQMARINERLGPITSVRVTTKNQTWEWHR